MYAYVLNLPFWKTLLFVFSDNEKSASFLVCVDICVVSNGNNRSNNRILYTETLNLEVN